MHSYLRIHSSVHSLLSAGYSTQRTISIALLQTECLNLLLLLMANLVSEFQSTLSSMRATLLFHFLFNIKLAHLPEGFLPFNRLCLVRLCTNRTLSKLCLVERLCSFSIIEFLGFHFVYHLFLYPPIKNLLFFQTDPDSFQFCFRSLSTTCRPPFEFGCLPVHSF